jgi:hypothetical protein
MTSGAESSAPLCRRGQAIALRQILAGAACKAGLPTVA